MADTILEVKGLKKYFKTEGGLLHAVDDVSFTIERGKTLGVVGESGCGKSTMGRCVIRLIEPTAGSVIFEGTDLLSLSGRQMKAKRKDMQMIFQDPYSSIDPEKTVFQTIVEGIQIREGRITTRNLEGEVLELMETVGLAERLINSYPHELDGGRRQRVGIARALAINPSLIICDEPVSALDVSIQAQILNLLQELQEERNLTYIFITHDLSVVNHISNDIIVMYLGQVVEKAPTRELFSNPVHPYTKALLSAIPIPKAGGRTERIPLKGEITSAVEPKDECRFAKRCPYCTDKCKASCPELREISPGHFVACHYFG